MLSEEIKEFLLKEATDRFFKYVQIWTTSDEDSQSNPSSKNQFDLGKVLVAELGALGLVNIIHDEYGYKYNTRRVWICLRRFTSK
jgi:di/tripeptidase